MTATRAGVAASTTTATANPFHAPRAGARSGPVDDVYYCAADYLGPIEGKHMKISVRAIAIMAASASLIAVPLAGSASAATQPGKCTKLTTKTVKTVLTATL